MSIVLAEPHPTEDKSKSHGILGTHPTVHLLVENIDGNLIAFEQKDEG
jgi:hypothetical protein